MLAQNIRNLLFKTPGRKEFYFLKHSNLLKSVNARIHYVKNFFLQMLEFHFKEHPFFRQNNEQKFQHKFPRTVNMKLIKTIAFNFKFLMLKYFKLC